MAAFGAALLRAIRRFGLTTFIVVVVVSFLFWIADQYAGNHVTDYLDSHSHRMVLWANANPVGAFAIIGFIFVMLCAFIATRDEWIRKLAESAGEPEIPTLQIIWKPGESVFVHSYELPPDRSINVEFRICVVNTSKSTTLTGIRVRLQDLRPYELPCVPCGLRLMNNTKEPLIDRFDLHPKEEQFVSVFVQKPNASDFWFLHTTPGIPWTAPAQAYVMRIVASCGPTRAEQGFEVTKNGLRWEMKAIDV
jgi:hypothetical protein